MSALATGPRVARAASELSSWFASVADTVSRAFGWLPDRHGEAAALHVLRRQALQIRSGRLGKDGASYTNLCLFLAAACRTLGLRLSERHWAAAVRNVLDQRGVVGDPGLGVALGTSTERFKMLLDDAIDAAGLGPRASVLDERNRRLALGLAVNWGVRALLAYALDAKPARGPGASSRRDLAWLGALLRETGKAA